MPTVESPGFQSSNLFTPVSLQIKATGATKYFAENLPVDLSISESTGLITGEIEFIETPFVKITVEDADKGKAECGFEWASTTAALHITKPPEQTGHKGLPVELNIEARKAVKYSATSLPAGLTINSETGLISGTPTTVESPTVKVEVESAAKATIEISFVWKIVAAIGLLRGGPKFIRTFTKVSIQVIASNTTKYFAENLPLGLSISESTGLITGECTIEESPVVKLKVKNAEAEEATAGIEYIVTTSLQNKTAMII